MTEQPAQRRDRNCRGRMRLSRLGPFALAILVWLALASAAVGPVMAAGPTAPAIGTRVTVTGPSTVAIGDSVSLTGRLTTLGGIPIASARLTMTANGTDVRNARTDASGRASLSMPSEFLTTAKTVAVRIVFSGDSTRSASSATMSLIVRPAKIEILTVPAVADIPMTLGDLKATTDATGVARFDVPTVGRYTLAPELSLPDSGGLRVSFARWQDDVFSLVRTIDVQKDAQFVLGVRIAVRTSLSFVDLDGNAVDPALVQSVLIQTSSGGERTLTLFHDIWLESEVPAKRTYGLVAVPNIHRVTEVQIAGTNVVNRGQQVWEPTLGGNLRIEILLYSLSVQVNDALLGSPVATKVSLEYPDGSIRTLATTAEGTVAFGSLPRGDYKIIVRASGIVPPSPIALSRPQEATIRVISSIDVSIAVGLALLAIVAMIMLGRRHQVFALAVRGRRLIDVAGGGTAIALARTDAGVRSFAAVVGTRLPGARNTADDGSWLPVGLHRAAARLEGAAARGDRAIRSVAENPGQRRTALLVGAAVVLIVLLTIAASLVRAAPASAHDLAPIVLAMIASASGYASAE